MVEHLKGKTAIVTGASGGIGGPVCKKLAGYGMNLVLAGRSREKLCALADTLDTRAVICDGDLTDLSYLDTLIAAAKTSFGGLDVLINNAGLAHNCTCEEVTPELFDEIWQTNVRAPYFLCQKAIPALRSSDCATIVNICSVVAHKGYPRQSVYAASKHALLGLSKSLANELYREDIRVHAISPGGVFTAMVAQTRPDLTPEGMILPEDVANIIGFLLENRRSAAVIDEIQLHRTNKEPFA